ncbi:hypothetical protein Rcae01_04725 [Novipirellula caenicola]|uniref:Uncharacterized protein n=1 Tax=Novipirellula caenicola TaxID=1536901 RepID=A0ABP9VWZ3_9BACT
MLLPTLNVKGRCTRIGLFAFISVFSALSCHNSFATFALVRSGYLTGKQLSATPSRTQQRNLSDSLG